MNITLDQARALDAVGRLGSFSAAAVELKRVHTAVLYAVNQVEQAVGLAVVDRSGYRATLTPLGLRVLEYCRKMLEAESELMRFCEQARLGHEANLAVVYDGLLPAGPILMAVRAAAERSPSTRVSLFSEFLGEVEARATREQAMVVLSVVPLEVAMAQAVPLAPLPSVLVVARGHALSRRGVTAEALGRHPFLTVRGSDRRLRMSTSELDKGSEFLMSDFHAKKVALLEGMGWGWMPEYLVEDELASGALKVVPWGEGRHVFAPVLHLRVKELELGIAATAFVSAIREAMVGGGARAKVRRVVKTKAGAR